MVHMKFTGNKEIDKQIKRGLGPLDPVNMDDYWDPTRYVFGAYC